MSFLNVYFNDELRSKHQLNPLITRIGRNHDNDIVIDNVGVSGNHAEIIKNGEQYSIYDLNSTNGVYINGEKVTQKELRFGDEIGIFKHKLRLIAIDLPTTVKTTTANPATDTMNNSNSATVEVDISKLDELLKKSIEKNAYLEVSNSPLAGRKIQLKKSRFSFGKSPDCDFEIGGWFTPRIAAKIVRQSDGYYLVPEKRGKTRLNGHAIKHRHKINEGSRIKIRGISFHFSNRLA